MRRRRGFTLIELLVVIGIIALLIAILLPALSKAQRSARAVACSANLRTILQAMITYANDHNGAFPGGPHTSGAHLVADPAASNAHCPGVSQIWDWQAPVARILRVGFDDGSSMDQRMARFAQLMQHRAFRCPENDILAGPYDTSGWPVVPMNSYVTAMVFHLRHYDGSAGQQWGITHCRPVWNVPVGYAPRLTRVGNSSRKIYIADGARFSTTRIAPDYDSEYMASHGGAYSDQGAFTRFTRSWDRGMAPGNGATGSADARIYGYRHGQRTAFGPADAYRFNAGFFDGHVESLGDLEGANPEFWVPRGTELTLDGSELYPDVQQRYAPAGAHAIAP